MHARPIEPGEKPDQESPTRLEIFGEWNDFPDISGLEYIYEAATDMRLSVPGPMSGLFPQRWADVIAFCDAHPMISEYWEKSLIFSMSEAYSLEYSNGTNPLRLAPVIRHRRAQEKNAKGD